MWYNIYRKVLYLELSRNSFGLFCYKIYREALKLLKRIKEWKFEEDWDKS